jgi:Tfp pilus assembly pilus retraction ATPase PilT
VSPLDRWLVTVRKNAGDALILHEGAPPTVLRDGRKVELKAPHVTEQEMETAVAAALPPSARQRLSQEGTASHSFRRAPESDEHVTVLALSTEHDRWLELRVRDDHASDADRDPDGRSDVYRWLESAWSLGASALIVNPCSPLFARVNGAMRRLDESPASDPADIQRVLMEFLQAEGVGVDAGTRAHLDLPSLGGIDCRVIEDRRGIGAIFSLPSRIPSVDDLHLPAALSEVCRFGEGLLIIAGTPEFAAPALHALVNEINRERPSHLVMLERHPAVLHESRSAVVSQREIASDDAEMWRAALQQAVCEGADVVTVEGVDRPGVLGAVLDTLRDGRLVIGTCSGAGTVEALELLCGGAPAFDPARLAETLVAAAAGRCVRHTKGQRAFVIEVLTPSPAVRSAMADGAFASVRLSLERGENEMISLTAALAALVAGGEVDVREAHRVAPDPAALALVLRTSRLAMPRPARPEVVGKPVDLSAMFDLLPGQTAAVAVPVGRRNGTATERI